MEVDRGPGCLFLRLKSPSEPASEAPEVAEEVWSLLETHFVYRLVLELDGVELLHSHLLGQLVLLDNRIREHNGMMRLCGLSPFNQRVLRTHGLDVRLPTYGDREEALMGCTRKPR
jgi:anti-anti-sigma factor